SALVKFSSVALQILTRYSRPSTKVVWIIV
ncbi:hypothetical protein D046_0893B, partial [Vibrio parahaemolyticus V-223/04]